MVWLGLSEFYFGAQTREKGESSSCSRMTGGGRGVVLSLVVEHFCY